MAGSKDKAAKQQLGTENQYAGGAGANANELYSTLNPMLMQEATNPSVAAAPEITASNQALGGALSSAMGQGNLMAARTRNAGGYAPALDAAARNAGKQQSQNALDVTNNVRQRGIQGLTGLYGSNLGELSSMLGLGNQSVGQMNGPLWQSILGAVQGAGAKGVTL